MTVARSYREGVFFSVGDSKKIMNIDNKYMINIHHCGHKLAGSIVALFGQVLNHTQTHAQRSYREHPHYRASCQIAHVQVHCG